MVRSFTKPLAVLGSNLTAGKIEPPKIFLLWLECPLRTGPSLRCSFRKLNKRWNKLFKILKVKDFTDSRPQHGVVNIAVVWLLFRMYSIWVNSSFGQRRLPATDVMQCSQEVMGYYQLGAPWLVREMQKCRKDDWCPYLMIWVGRSWVWIEKRKTLRSLMATTIPVLTLSWIIFR